jgi:DNA-binding XRE family transcriptional regulator
MKKRTRIDDKFGRRRDLIPAVDVRRVRAALGMTQVDFATAIGVSPRTVVRAEQRGLEVPMRPDTKRPEVWVNWCRLQRSIK